MINDTDRQELINYRLEQATETIESHTPNPLSHSF